VLTHLHAVRFFDRERKLMKGRARLHDGLAERCSHVRAWPAVAPMTLGRREHCPGDRKRVRSALMKGCSSGAPRRRFALWRRSCGSTTPAAQGRPERAGRRTRDVARRWCAHGVDGTLVDRWPCGLGAVRLGNRQGSWVPGTASCRRVARSDLETAVCARRDGSRRLRTSIERSSEVSQPIGERDARATPNAARGQIKLH
jgi:hypothetical protein